MISKYLRIFYLKIPPFFSRLLPVFSPFSSFLLSSVHLFQERLLLLWPWKLIEVSLLRFWVVAISIIVLSGLVWLTREAQGGRSFVRAGPVRPERAKKSWHKKERIRRKKGKKGLFSNNFLGSLFVSAAQKNVTKCGETFGCLFLEHGKRTPTKRR